MLILRNEGYFLHELVRRQGIIEFLEMSSLFKLENAEKDITVVLNLLLGI